jgi:hypothetical protein
MLRELETAIDSAHQLREQDLARYMHERQGMPYLKELEK